jgi:hypothetical protein
MRTPRPLIAALLLLALFTGCARCGSKAASSPERFLAADDAGAVIVPSLEELSRQGADVLATAATFPGGDHLLDARGVLQARLGFDPFDAASVAGAGLDAKRGAAIGLRQTTPGGEPETILSLPVADAAKFDAALTRLAKERLHLSARSAEKGKPEVIAWRDSEGGSVQVAYALAERNAVVGVGPKAVELVRTALAVPAQGHLGTTPAYKTASAAAGPGLALLGFVPPGSPALEKMPQLKDGFAFGLRGAKDHLDLVGCTLLGDRETAVKASIKGASTALLAKVDPAASVVARGEGDLQAMVPRDELLAMLGKQGSSKDVEQLVLDAYESIDSGTAFGFSLVPVADGRKVPVLMEEPLGFFKVEMLLALKDPAKMKSVLQRAVKQYGGGRMKAGGDGRYTTPLPGGEVAVAVEGQQLLVAAGPAGTLKALSGRSGSAFKGPTPTSAKALEGGMGGMVVDVGKLSAGVKAIPAAAYGDGASSGAIHSSVQQWATTAARFPAISARSELVPGAQRSELVIEVAAAPAK